MTTDEDPLKPRSNKIASSSDAEIQFLSSIGFVDELFENSFGWNGKDLGEILDHLMTNTVINRLIYEYS